MSPESETQAVTLVRRFDAPIELVYRAWTEAEHVVKWMKCDVGVTLEVDGWVAEVGTEFRTHMRQPGVFESHSRGRFTVVEPPHLLEFVYDADPDLGVPAMTVRVALESDGAGTIVTLTQSGIPGELCDLIDGGWTSSFSQLATLVSPDEASGEEVV